MLKTATVPKSAPAVTNFEVLRTVLLLVKVEPVLCRLSGSKLTAETVAVGADD